MAIRNDPRMYSLGAEVIEPKQHERLYLSLLQQEQAKNQAFDDYIRNLNKNVNPAGMRNQEREVFEEKLREWQDYGIKNTEALRNPRKDNGMSSMQFQSMYQDLQNLISESKTREEGKKPIIPMLLDPDKRHRMGQEFMEEISTHDAPLYTKDETGKWIRNPNSRTIDITKLNFKPTPFDQEKFSKGLEDIKPSKSSQSVRKLPNFKEEITTVSEFMPEDKEAVAYRSIAEYGNNKSFREFIKELNPEEKQTLANVYQTEFGQPAKDDAHLAAAYGIKIKQQGATKTEVKDDSFAQRKELTRLSDAYSRGRMEMSRAWKKADKATQDTWVDGQIEEYIQSAKAQGQRAYKDSNGKIQFGFSIPLDAVIANALKRDGREPDALRFNADGTFQPIFLKRDEGGNAIRKNGEYEINETLSVPVSRKQLKAAYSKQFGVKQANLEMGGMGGDGDESESFSETIGILD